MGQIPPSAFAGFIDQVELTVFEWNWAREQENAYLNDDVQKLLKSVAKSLKLLDKHQRFVIDDDTPKDRVTELTRQHLRMEQALQPIFELICPGWTDRPRPDVRRALVAIKAASGIGVMGPKHQSDPPTIAAAERIALAWQRYSRLPLSGGSQENTPQGFLTALLCEINVYRPYGLISGRPERMPRAVLAAFLEQVVKRELPLTIDRIRNRAG